MVVIVPKGHAPLIRISWPCTPWADHNGWLWLFPRDMSPLIHIFWPCTLWVNRNYWVVYTFWVGCNCWVVCTPWVLCALLLVVHGYCVVCPAGGGPWLLCCAPCWWWSMVIASLARCLRVYTLVMCGLCLCLSELVLELFPKWSKSISTVFNGGCGGRGGCFGGCAGCFGGPGGHSSIQCSIFLSMGMMLAIVGIDHLPLSIAQLILLWLNLCSLCKLCSTNASSFWHTATLCTSSSAICSHAQQFSAQPVFPQQLQQQAYLGTAQSVFPQQLQQQGYPGNSSQASMIVNYPMTYTSALPQSAPPSSTTPNQPQAMIAGSTNTPSSSWFPDSGASLLWPQMFKTFSIVFPLRDLIRLL